MDKSATFRVLKNWLPVVLWMGVIFIMSTDIGSADHTSRVLEPIVRWFDPTPSSEELATVHFFVRKTAHLSEYAVLGLLFYRAVRSSRIPSFGSGTAQSACIAWLGSAAYAATDEFHQSFVPGRTASPVDVMIDSSGALIALTILLVVAKCAKNKLVNETVLS